MARTARPRNTRPESLLSIRVAFILLLGILSGVAVAALTVVAGRPIADAVLAGIAAIAAGIRFFHWLID